MIEAKIMGGRIQNGIKKAQFRRAAQVLKD